MVDRALWVLMVGAALVTGWRILRRVPWPRAATDPGPHFAYLVRKRVAGVGAGWGGATPPNRAG